MHKNISLRPYNTFSIDVYAEKFCGFQSVAQLEELTSTERPSLILGGGSNILFTKNVEGLVLKNNIPGIEVTDEDDEYVFVKTGAGVSWQELVLFCLENNYGGIENLALIPGNTGASPMQNIGAYGVEIEDVFHNLQAWHLADKELVNFNKEACDFGYRESVFKNKFKGQFVICNIILKLSKHPVLKIEYGAITGELERLNILEPTIRDVASVVMNIRRSKLPDPGVLGNAGSFFKNPVISAARFDELKKEFPGMPGYVLTEEKVKLAAAWLIESCGWKGYRQGDAGCHNKQPLVLVNYAKATGAEVFELSAQIKVSVFEKFAVELEREVNVL